MCALKINGASVNHTQNTLVPKSVLPAQALPGVIITGMLWGGSEASEVLNNWAWLSGSQTQVWPISKAKLVTALPHGHLLISTAVLIASVL